MGRKKGQQQRVKGNVLPSSSVRSADLLARESMNAGLGLFQSLPSMALGSLPELAGLDSISSTEFRTVLKKLYKRDVTTKLKALVEFCRLCESAEQHDILEMLPYWPRIFNRLFEDSERRVRENTQKAMHAVVSAAGKNLALQLKNLMGCWFVSQCDSYSPAALSAEAAINEAFTGDKKISAYIFCREDILSCIGSYVFAPQAKRDKSTEEEGNNFHRMVAACLEAMSLFIRTVVYHKPLDGEIESFLDNSSFWKFQKHTSPSIRAGFYSMLESICIVTPSLANAHSTEVCRSIFHRLDENNVLVCKALYAAAVAATAKCESWYNKIDIHKGLLAGLRNSLKSGCYGLVAYVLPTLLPIFASLPFNSDTLNVFTKLFETLRLCIVHGSTVQSKHSTELAVASYMEIVKLAVKRLSDNIDDMETIRPFCESLVNDELLATVKSSWSVESSKYFTHSVLDIIPSVIQNWESHKSDCAVVYNVLLTTFWAELSNLVQKECFVHENQAATSHIGMFLHCLCHKVKRTGTRRSVQFKDSCSKDLNLTVVDGSVETKDREMEGRVCSCVNKIVLDCKLLLPLRKDMLTLQKHLYEKLGNEMLFCDLSELADAKASGGTVDKVKVFLNSVLVPQLFTLVETPNCDCAQLELVSSILTHVIKSCQAGAEFPCDLYPFVSSEHPAYRAVLLQLFMNLLLTADYKTGPWLYYLINENSLFQALENSKSVCKYATSCSCSADSQKLHGLLDVEKCWQLLENLVTVSYDNESGSTTYICCPDLRCEIITIISTAVSELCNCPNCFEAAIIRFANIMVRLLTKGLGHLVVGESNKMEEIWQKLMTDLFEHYYIANDHQTILELFGIFFSFAAKGDMPFSRLVVGCYVQSLGLQISQNIIQQNGLDKLNFALDIKMMVLTILKHLHDSRSILTFLETLLPSSEEWCRIRKFDISAVKIDSTNDTILLPSRTEPIGNIIDTFSKIIMEAMPCVHEICKDFSWCDCSSYLLLVEESVMSCAISKDRSSIFDNTLFAVKQVVFSEIVQKSLAVGGLWAYSLKALVDVFNDGVVDVIFDQFVSSFERSEVSASLFQTMLLLLKSISDKKLGGLLHEIYERLKVEGSDQTSASDVYSLAFGLNAACAFEPEQKSEVIDLFHALILKWKSANIGGFLDDDGDDVFKTELIVLRNAVGKFYSCFINLYPESLCEDDWDFIQCALLAWIESVARYRWENEGVLASVLELANGSFKLLKVVIKFMSSSTAMDDPTIPSSLVSEWIGFFSNAINTSLVKIFLDINLTAVSPPIFQELCECLQYVSSDSIYASVGDLKPKLTANSYLPDDVQTLVNHLCLCFITNEDVSNDKHRCMEIMMSYHLMVKILDRLLTQETDRAPNEIWNVMRKLSVKVAGSFEVEEIEAPKSLVTVSNGSDSDDLNDRDDEEAVANTSLADAIGSDAISVLSYLLLWRILIKLTKFINSDKKSAYVNSIMKQNSPNISEDLLPHLFKIMVGKKTHFKVAPDLLTEGETVDFEFIQHVSACVYKEFLLEMPAASRAWFNDLPKVIRSRVDKFTSSNVSPVLIENEFKAIRATASQQNKDGMEISAKPGAREVHASYQLNELKMEIAVCLPSNHPLGPITVNTEKRAGVVVGQWRYWILQITSFLQFQNGGIIDGLLMWKEKVDKKFEGMEECMICFSLVHGSSQNLPKLKCKTCKKKYHAQCLYKWFDTSNNSTCPLCRSPMIFR